MRWLFALLFGCRHAELTRPWSIGGRVYQVCLDCGRELAYTRISFSTRTCGSPTAARTRNSRSSTTEEMNHAIIRLSDHRDAA